jgi:hypothetical protein
LRGIPIVRIDRRFQYVTAIVALFAITACRDLQSQADGPKPVPMCEEYERAVARCSGRNTPIAHQTAAMASNEAERIRLFQLCVINLERLNAACR